MPQLMKNAVFLDVTPCGSCRNERLEEHIASIIKVKRISELGTTSAVTSVLQFLVTANVPSSLIFFTLMM
jgi:hypothetical protein